MQSTTGGDEKSLAQLFERLAPEDRKANLTRLVASLSAWEAWHLERELRHASPLAELGDLPLELVVMVSQFLDLSDIFRCIRVSTVWNRIWTHPLVVDALYRRFFPGHDRDGDDFARFRDLSRTYLRRKWGRPTSKVWKRLRYSDETFFTLDPKFHPDGKYPEIDCRESEFGRIWYRHGLMIWQAKRGVFVLDNLYTLQRRVLQFKGTMALQGVSVEDLSLSKSLVIFQSPNRLVVFHLGANTWGRVTLPGPMKTCESRGELFAVLLKSNEVIVQKFDGRQVSTVLEKDVGPLMQAEGFTTSHLGIMFGPDQPGESLFVVAVRCSDASISSSLECKGQDRPLFSPGSCEVRVVVFELELLQSWLAATHIFDVERILHLGELGEPAIKDGGGIFNRRIGFSCEAINDDGLYSIISLRVKPEKATGQCFEVALTFNTRTRIFGMQSYKFEFDRLRLFVRDATLRLWDDKLVFLYRNQDLKVLSTGWSVEPITFTAGLQERNWGGELESTGLDRYGPVGVRGDAEFFVFWIEGRGALIWTFS